MAPESSCRLKRIGWIAIVLACLQLQEVLAKPLSFFTKRRFETRYREILSLYAEGETEIALDTMVELEDEVIAGDYSTQETVRRVEIGLAKRLAKHSVDALEAVIYLHEALYRRYRDRGDPAAAGHARETMVEMAFEFAGMKTAAGDPGETAKLLSRQGKEVLASHAETIAVSLFEKAIELDSEVVGARLCLAWIHEKRGRYEEAFDSLRALVELDPGHREGRLRSAIQMARRGRELEASSLLDSLSSSVPNDWIRVLAVQERARILADSGELESALRLVSEALDAMPCQDGLAVQVSYLNDRIVASNPPEMLDDRLRRCLGTQTVSPRDLYNRLPSSCAPSPANEEDLRSPSIRLRSALARMR